jgi:hypothetical protein
MGGVKTDHTHTYAWLTRYKTLELKTKPKISVALARFVKLCKVRFADLP